MARGTINVQTENIFPIIKKFLYSDHEIFLRELVSNSVDASNKLKVLVGSGESSVELGDLTIEVRIDKDKGTLHVVDRGIGMTQEELEKYICQIAFSGAEEFVNKYKDKPGSEQIIGHFGLGFFSAFMVADKVEVYSQSYQEGEKGVHWVSDGTPEYDLELVERADRGTEVVLHLSEDSKEFLQESKVMEVLEKYCKFLPVPIRFGTRTEYVDDPDGAKDEEGNIKQVPTQVDRIINNPEPAWTKSPNSLNDEDYAAFYRELYPMSMDEPMFHIHLNVDYPFNLTGILYFPRLKGNLEIQRNKVQLYCNQVFVTDSVENIVPEFLTMLHGVIDSPDIPLNVSRSYLQGDPNVKKISAHVTKKVSDKLNEIFTKDREGFQEKWDDLKVLVQYGQLTDEKFFERSSKFYLLKDVDGGYQTLEEHLESIAPNQTDKNEDRIILYTNDAEAHHSFVKAAKEKGYSVVLMDSPLDAHWVTQMESKQDKVKFARVDSDTLEKLIQKDEEIPSKLSDDQKDTLRGLYEGTVDPQKFHVHMESRYETDPPVIVTQSEFMRRMQEQQRLGGGQFMGNFPEMYNLVVNVNHPVAARILEAKTDQKRQRLTEQVCDLALLGQGLLKGDRLTQFIDRSVDLIK